MSTSSMPQAVAANTSTDSVKHLTDAVIQQAGTIILGKKPQLSLALACLLARGHLLIEDLPGVGKTTLAHVLAKILGLEYSRIQFTSDLLPADILGVSIFDRGSGAFEFHPGPVFSQIILADEINRATPKAQSALLEAMEEYQVSIEGETRPLPKPFFVIATQNPTYQVGTFPLPESQLDRFLMRIELGYPDKGAERALLIGEDRRELLEKIEPCLDIDQLLQIQSAVDLVHTSEALLDYLQAILEFTRKNPDFVSGLSPRAGLALLHCAKAWALLDGRKHVLPEDVQAVLPYVVSHRLKLATDTHSSSHQDIARQLLDIPIP